RDEERRQDHLLGGCRGRRLGGVVWWGLVLGAGHSSEAEEDEHRRQADHPVRPTASLTHGPERSV
ncbi:MAG: hypothetical protein DME06_13550, partial [Candidatus Rokuibacteriota bacterium]